VAGEGTELARELGGAGDFITLARNNLQTKKPSCHWDSRSYCTTADSDCFRDIGL